MLIVGIYPAIAIAALYILLPSLSHAQERNVYYILDASGSMWGQMQGRTKIEIAKEVLLDRLPILAGAGFKVGLLAYGHRRRGDCGDIEQLVDLGPLDEQLMREKVEAIVPKGKTPIAGSIAAVAEELRVREEESHVILISDGKETCHENPCEAVRELRDLGIEFTLDVIGFDISEEERAQLQCIAEAGGGRYFPATSAPELYEAILKAEETPPPPRVAQNIQIVLDRSVQMNNLFEGRSKIDVATERIARTVLQPGAEFENLALRTFGGECEQDDNTALDVSFATGNGKSIGEMLEGLSLYGNPTLASALRASIQDFDSPTRFAGVSNRVVVVTGSRGYCDPREAEAVYEQFTTKKIVPDIYFIAMDVPPSELDDLKRMAAASGARLYPVRTEDELDRAMEQIFEVIPVISGVQAITQILNDVVGHLNSGIRSVSRQDYDEGSRHVDEGRRVMFESDPQFADLGARQTRQVFKDLYGLADSNRELQERGFDLIDDFVQARRDDEDVQAYNALISEWNQMISTYNSNVRQMGGLLSSLQ